MERILEKTKINGKFHNLIKADLPVAAVFEHNDRGAECILLNKEGKKDDNTGSWEWIEFTGCTIKFKGGKFVTQNEKMVELIMTHKLWEDGKIRMDKTDPTGFWRQLGAVKTESVQVVHVHDQANVKFTQLDLKSLKASEEEITPALQVN